jgi:drug/metabolite transporter (DMT)-like permease
MLDFLLQNWLISAVLCSVALGIVAFVNKIFAERRYNQQFSAVVLFGEVVVLSLIYVAFFEFRVLTSTEFILTILWGVAVAAYSVIMMTALRYLPTSTYFVNVRLISSLVLLLIGMFIFHDKLSAYEAIGFMIGVIAMTLLFEKEDKSNFNYIKGTQALLLGAGSLIITNTITKMLSVEVSKVPTILMLLSISAFVTSLVIGAGKIKDCKKDFWPIFKINIIQAVAYFFFFVMLMNVYRMGDLGISYKILSYSPFIPIVLAAMVYKEKISFKKKIALVLVAVSLWFFK